MSATPIWLDQNSAGAPDLGATVGSLYNVFKWGLPQLGWTLEHDDPAKSTAVFRNNPATGTGYYVRIIDDPAHGPHTIPEVAWFDAFMTAESITPAETPLPIGGPGIIKTSSATSLDGHNFVLVGCDRFFYILIDTFKLNWFFPAYAGDVVPITPTDSTAFMISSHSGENIEATSTVFNSHNITMSNVYGVTFGSIYACGEWMTNMAGAKASADVYPRCFDAWRISSALGDVEEAANPVTGEQFCVPVAALLDVTPRGFLPGLYNLGRSMIDYSHLQDVTGLPDGFGGVFDGRVSNFGNQYPRWSQIRAETRACFMMNRDWYSVL